MPQFVQFADGIVNGMEIKMGGDVIAVLIVRRVLDRAEFVNFMAFWHNYHAAGDAGPLCA